MGRPPPPGKLAGSWSPPASAAVARPPLGRPGHRRPDVPTPAPPARLTTTQPSVVKAQILRVRLCSLLLCGPRPHLNPSNPAGLQGASPADPISPHPALALPLTSLLHQKVTPRLAAPTAPLLPASFSQAGHASASGPLHLLFTSQGLPHPSSSDTASTLPASSFVFCTCHRLGRRAFHKPISQRVGLSSVLYTSTPRHLVQRVAYTRHPAGICKERVNAEHPVGAAATPSRAAWRHWRQTGRRGVQAGVAGGGTAGRMGGRADGQMDGW